MEHRLSSWTLWELPAGTTAPSTGQPRLSCSGGQAPVKPCCPLLLLGNSPTLWKRARYLCCSGPRNLGYRLGSDIFAEIG